MGIDRLLKNDGLKEQERIRLKTVKAIVESPEKSCAKITEFEKLQERCAAVSGRQKILLEMAAEREKNSFTGHVGKHLFVSRDAQLQNRILCPEKSLEKCGRYIMKQAENMARKGNREALCVSDDVVYGWAEDYFRAENIKDSDLIVQFPAVQGSRSGVREKTGAASVQPSAQKKKPEKRKTVTDQTAKSGKGTDMAEKQEESVVHKTVAGPNRKADEENSQISLFDICPA